MKTMSHKGEMELVTILVEPGEMLLETVVEAIRAEGIENGVIVSGIGTLKTCQLHCITHTDYPSDNHFWTIEKPLELLSVSGIVADGEPHLHVVLSCGEHETMAGHLEPESEVAYLAEIAILKANGLRMKRRRSEKGTMMLGPK